MDFPKRKLPAAGCVIRPDRRDARRAEAPASQSDDRFNTADVKPFRLVFSGATALSRAHRLTRRMSEDIDLKIVSDERRLRAEFRELRDSLTSALLHAGFRFDPENAAHGDSGNASRYTIYRLPYTPLVTGEGALRPEIQIETAVWPLRLAPVEQSVTFFGRRPLSNRKKCHRFLAWRSSRRSRRSL